eukprot:TRINITY_DN27284_c0_g1_i1.p1 TRINITY_DN27284_c0_g1~~TRINITY_DN27284_c0_g1_i1.p1  ORF type:complete len:471 (+),score=108.96 TRINITY_DN27284_c0_g1_i1:201-1415(+)
MTTIPKRIDHIEPVLDSMLRQTYPIEALYLSIPYVYNRTGESYIIPSWLAAKQGVTILRCEDLGPGTHLLNGLRVERDPWKLFAVVDDDHIYAPDLVENLVRAALAQPGTAVAAQGFLSVPGMKITRDMPRYLHDQGFEAGPVLVSYLGVIYQRGFFDDSVFDYGEFAEQCVYQDDMWFSAHLAKKGIKRRVIGAALGVQELKEFHLGPSSLTMWQENKPREVSEKCNDSLLRKLPSLWQLRRRLVLALGGLHLTVKDLESANALGALAPLRRVLEQLKRLQQPPDLVYICTAASGPGGDAGKVVGAPLLLDEVPVTVSGGCSGEEAPGVRKLLRAPLEWEGDGETVVVVGQLDDLSGGVADVSKAAECAVGPEASPFCRAGELVGVSVAGLSGGVAGARRAEL